MTYARPITILFLAVIGVLLGMAVWQQPVDFWLTADQQGDRFSAGGDFAAAAKVYEDPVRQGVAMFRDGDFESAAGAFARVDEPEPAFNRGNALVMLGRYDDAIESYDRALQFRPDWQAARENRDVAVARRERLEPPDDSTGGMGSTLKPDEIVFDNRAENSPDTEEVEVGKGEQMSDDELRALWLQRVQTSPGDFLRTKFSYQLARRSDEDRTSNE